VYQFKNKALSSVSIAINVRDLLLIIIDLPICRKNYRLYFMFAVPGMDSTRIPFPWRIATELPAFLLGDIVEAILLRKASVRP
jgi:hypothetical protein